MSQASLPTIDQLWFRYAEGARRQEVFVTVREMRHARRAFYAAIGYAFEAIKQAAEIEPEEKAIDLLLQMEDELATFEAIQKAGQE